jgi:hypothetical protein
MSFFFFFFAELYSVATSLDCDLSGFELLPNRGLPRFILVACNLNRRLVRLSMIVQVAP